MFEFLSPTVKKICSSFFAPCIIEGISIHIGSMKNFEKLIESWMLDEDKGETSEEFPWKISEEQKLLLKDKVSICCAARTPHCTPHRESTLLNFDLLNVSQLYKDLDS